MAASRSVQFKYPDVYNRRVVGGVTCDEKDRDILTKYTSFLGQLRAMSPAFPKISRQLLLPVPPG